MSRLFAEDIELNNTLTMRIHELGRDFDAIFEELDSKYYSKAISLTSLSSMLFSRAQSKGLDDQKSWISDALLVKSSTFSNVLFYFKGIASEGGRDPLDIMDTLHTQLFSHIENDGLAMAIYISTLPMPISLEAFRVIMCYISGEAAVDQYEMAVNAVTSSLLSNVKDFHFEVRQLLKLMERCGDWRAKAIENLINNSSSSKISVPLTCLQSVRLLQENTGTTDPARITDREFRTQLADCFLLSSNTPDAYLALSHYITRYATNVDEYLQGVSKREVAIQYFEREGHRIGTRTALSLNFDALACQTRREKDLIERRELFKLACLLGISEEKLLELLLLLYDETRGNQAVTTYFPVDQLLDIITDDDVAEIAIDPKVASALASISDTMGEDGISLQFLAVDQYLEANGVRKPSEIEEIDEDVENFLYEACSIECIKQSLEFESSSEVEEERLRILYNLRALKSAREQQYEADIHKIVGQQTVDELLKRYEVGKIHCDEREIKIWARETLTARYIRLRDYIGAGMLPVERESDIEFISHISEGRAGSFVFKVPSSDAYNIARSIIEELLQKYSLDPRHGIDSYLSLGMRHGALIDHLRSPLSSNQMITSKTVSGYEPSEYWKHTFALSGDPDIGELVSEKLIEFSEKYDKKLKALKDDLIQVKRTEKPEGIIDLDWSDGEILAFMPTFIRLESLDETLDEFSQYYWQLTEARLAPSRRYILNEVKADLFKLITELEQELQDASGYQRLGPFTDQVMRAKDELSSALEELATWHNVAKSTDKEPISLPDIISASEKIARRLHPSFEPTVTISGDKEVSLSSSLNILIEVFKALYINVCVHSGVTRPKVIIEISSEDPKALIVTFKSSCRDTHGAQAAAEMAQERIMSGEYEDKLSTEGGSGLPKVARATVSDGKPQTTVWVDKDKRLFCVKMSFVLINLNGDP
ncbi:hypothetical protein XM52_28355 [Roseovarius indicus]|nr:hypothetical protein XM52_28355 [Roseovarius indicus]